MKRSTIIKSFIICFAILCCCICFTGCDISAYVGEKDLSGDYNLVSFTDKNGTTYKVGDDYEGTTISSEDIQLEIDDQLDNIITYVDDKPIQGGGYTLQSSDAFDLYDSGLFWKDANNQTNLTFIIALSSWSLDPATGKVNGNKITITFPTDYFSDVHSVTFKKV